MDRLTVSTVRMATRDDLAVHVGTVWRQVKARVVISLLWINVLLCLAMSVMLVVEKAYMAAAVVVVKLLGLRPDRHYKWERMRADGDDDVELGSPDFPVVLVQIPMFNEKDVYRLSIAAARSLSWPSDRIVIQVLDDSTDPATRVLASSQG